MFQDRLAALEGAEACVATASGMSAILDAWVLLKGMETLEIRMLAQSERALELARWLEMQPKVSRVYYPGLDSHP